MPSAVTILEKKVAQMETDLRRLRAGHTELSGEIEMVSDSSENVQWGLINMGGYTNFHNLTPFQRSTDVHVGTCKFDSCKNNGDATLLERCEDPEPR